MLSRRTVKCQTPFFIAHVIAPPCPVNAQERMPISSSRAFTIFRASMETLSPATLKRQGLLDPVAANRVLDDHVAGREDLSRQLWGLLALTLWYERHA